MELQQLRYVIPVAETLSFTRAHVTQSALSHQIAALERGLGQALFARSSRSVRLTEAGAAFLPHARTALAAAARAAEDAASANGSVVGTLRVGMIPTVTAVPVPALLARSRRRPSARRNWTGRWPTRSTRRRCCSISSGRYWRWRCWHRAWSAARADDVVAVPVADGPVRVEYVAWDARAPRRVATAFLDVLEESRERVRRS